MDTQGYLNSDHELLLQVAAGSQRAFAVLVERYSAKIYAHVLTYLKNASRSEEITQDIFLKLWETRADLPGIDNFPGYLHVITRNRTISELRKKLEAFNEAGAEDVEDVQLNPGLQMEYRQLSDILLRGIDLLPPRRKQVFRMSRFDGMSYERIAAELGISKGTVNEHIVEALLFLRSYLRNQSGDVISTLLLLVYVLLSDFF